MTIRAETAPTDASLTVDVTLGAAEQTKIGTLASGAQDQTTVFGAALAVATNDVIRVKIKSIGSTLPGEDVTVILYYASDVVQAGTFTDLVATNPIVGSTTDGDTHAANTSNPHSVTAAQVGAESSTSNNIDPDRLAGDTVDDDLIDDAIISTTIARDSEVAAAYSPLGHTHGASTLDTDSVSADELNAAGVESELEAVIDLQDLQGAVTDAQVPNTVTIDLATLASTVAVVDSTDATSFPLMVDSATGSLAAKTDGGLTYNSTTGVLTAAGFAGPLTGNADTSTTATTATTANAGDSATAFFAAGSIEHEYGGMEANVAAYSGLVGINAGVTVEVDTLSEFNTMMGTTGTPSSTTFLRGDNVWETPAGGGDVTAAASFGTDNVLIKSDGTGKGVQATGIVVGDNNAITGIASIGTDAFTIRDAVDQSNGLGFIVASDLIADKTFTYTGAFNFGMTLSADTAVTYPTTGTLISSGHTFTGDVTATLDTDGSTAMTVAADSVALTTDTTGDYVETITGDSEISVSGAGTEGRAVTLAIGSTIARDSELPIGANPTGTAGLSVVNGSATTFLRSDGSPAISQAITPTWSGLHIFDDGVDIKNGSTTAGLLRIYEDSDDGTNFASFTVPALAANTVYTLPPDDGAAGQVLHTDGAGVLTWDSDDGAGGGAPTDADYLVGTANGTLSNEIVVGTAPGGELGGSWASPTIDDSLTVTGWDLGTSVATTPAANDNDTSIATTAYTQTELTAYASDTVTLTNKTFDAAATGNVLKAKGYVYLNHPHLADGTGATINTTATAISYGHATFSNSADEAGNYVEYYFQVPEDIDTAVALRGRIKVFLGGADTATQRYVLSSVSVADSAVPTASTLANAINIDFAGDGSGASGDVETSAWTTLTSWDGALTAGQTWRIRFSRDGNATQDASTVNSTELGLVIEYGITQ